MKVTCLVGERQTADLAILYNGTLSAKVGSTQNHECISLLTNKKSRALLKVLDPGLRRAQQSRLLLRRLYR